MLNGSEKRPSKPTVEQETESSLVFHCHQSNFTRISGKLVEAADVDTFEQCCQRCSNSERCNAFNFCPRSQACHGMAEGFQCELLFSKPLSLGAWPSTLIVPAAVGAEGFAVNNNNSEEPLERSATISWQAGVPLHARKTQRFPNETVLLQSKRMGVADSTQVRLFFT